MNIIVNEKISVGILKLVKQILFAVFVLITAILLMLILSASSKAADIYVDTGGNGNYLTIQDASLPFR